MPFHARIHRLRFHAETRDESDDASCVHISCKLPGRERLLHIWIRDYVAIIFALRRDNDHACRVPAARLLRAIPIPVYVLFSNQ